MADQSVDFKKKAKTTEGLQAGRRTIGQVAGHEIHQEIEDVQDKKNRQQLKNMPTKLN